MNPLLTLEVSDVLVVVVLEEEVPRLEGVEDVGLRAQPPQRHVQLAQLLGQRDVRHEHLLQLAVQREVAARFKREEWVHASDHGSKCCGFSRGMTEIFQWTAERKS